MKTSRNSLFIIRYILFILTSYIRKALSIKLHVFQVPFPSFAMGLLPLITAEVLQNSMSEYEYDSSSTICSSYSDLSKSIPD